MEKAMEFAERMRKVQKEVGAALMKVQEEMKKQVDRGSKQAKEWKVGNRVILSIKDLIFKERLARKLVDWYIGLYIIDKIVSTNAVKLQLLMSMRIHPVVSINWVVWYRDQVKGQKKEEEKPVEVEGVEEWEVEKILNKRKVRGVTKYLVWWKGFIAENNS